ncbi:winged helix-turn-helix domain-containing protein [Halorhabdus amylolytica]|uniref:winged helix-turn-helix domain-containing protein n=1 Tax=Halorhabdus amylolytica TaxID=2559573 RepID=UPI0010AAF732|nr:winged helix-turn-helix domain-containing protein [Halorhabdus amylolytica]
MSSEPVRSRVDPDSPRAAPPAANRDDKRLHEDPTALLEALGDEYTRAAFEAVLDRPRSGQAVATVTDMSQPTAFRRLNTLVDLGLVETDHRIDTEEGHHHKEYRSVVDSFSVTIDGEIGAVIETDHRTGSRFEQPTPVPAND